jgi:hypothetical protein
MKALGRRLAIILAIMVGLFAILLLGRWWSASQDMLELDRAHLYGRAIDQVGAAHATPTTASQFRLILLPDTPVKDRPAGAPAGAFAGMAPAVLACPLTDAELRRSGPGRCSAAAVALKEPAVCAFIACVVVEAPVAFLEHSGTRQALKANDLRKRVCAMHGPRDPMGWRRDSAGLPECRSPGIIPAVVLIAERVSDRDYRYRLLL